MGRAGFIARPSERSERFEPFVMNLDLLKGGMQ